MVVGQVKTPRMAIVKGDFNSHLSVTQTLGIYVINLFFLHFCKLLYIALATFAIVVLARLNEHAASTQCFLCCFCMTFQDWKMEL